VRKQAEVEAMGKQPLMATASCLRMLCKLPLPQDIACLQRDLRRWVHREDAEGEVFGGPRRRDTHVIEEAIDRAWEWIAANHGLTYRALPLPRIRIEFNADKGWI
jgi:hypothetical protein